MFVIKEVEKKDAKKQSLKIKNTTVSLSELHKTKTSKNQQVIINRQAYVQYTYFVRKLQFKSYSLATVSEIIYGEKKLLWKEGN